MESGGPLELVRWVSGHSWGRSGSPGSLTGGGRAWPLDRYGRRGNTCLVCDLESVLLAQGWLCCLLEALNGEKREGWSTGGMISLFFPLPPHVGGVDTGLGAAGDEREPPGLQERPHWGLWGQKGLGSSPNTSFLGLHNEDACTCLSRFTGCYEVDGRME